MTYSRIIATGSYLPSKILTNHDLEKRIDTTDEWIVERTGIRQRHIAADDETASSMAEEATRAALDTAGIAASALELVIVATTTPDKIMPSTACILQQRLDISGMPAFDITAACSGFVYALSIADQFIRTGAVKTALVVGSELMSKVVDWSDRSTCVLFGDGAGAAILQASDSPGIINSYIHADGNHGDMLTVPSGLSSVNRDAISPTIQMSGQEVFKFATNTLGMIVEETLAHNNIDRSEIDWLVPHQANLRIIAAMAKKLSLPMEHVILTLQDHGNTSAASIPIALDIAVRDGRIQRGHKLLLEAIGGGLTWGSALVEF